MEMTYSGVLPSFLPVPSLALCLLHGKFKFPLQHTFQGTAHYLTNMYIPYLFFFFENDHTVEQNNI